MNCPEARRLLERGVTPGSSPPERAALGFHLASCSECRAFRAKLNDHLLASLLAQAAAPPPAQVADPAATIDPPDPVAARQPWHASIGQMLWYGSVGLLAAFALAIVIIV